MHTKESIINFERHPHAIDSCFVLHSFRSIITSKKHSNIRSYGK